MKSSNLINKITQIVNTYDAIIKCSEYKIIDTGGKIRISLTCGFQSELKFDEVHDKVTLLESKIYAELKDIYPNLVNVIIHAEPCCN
jgi:divalent metal cation (Fe/Co/Zn/Cd) transporter